MENTGERNEKQNTKRIREIFNNECRGLHFSNNFCTTLAMHSKSNYGNIALSLPYAERTLLVPTYCSRKYTQILHVYSMQKLYPNYRFYKRN